MFCWFDSISVPRTLAGALELGSWRQRRQPRQSGRHGPVAGTCGVTNSLSGWERYYSIFTRFYSNADFYSRIKGYFNIVKTSFLTVLYIPSLVPSIRSFDHSLAGQSQHWRVQGRDGIGVDRIARTVGFQEREPAGALECMAATQKFTVGFGICLLPICQHKLNRTHGY